MHPAENQRTSFPIFTAAVLIAWVALQIPHLRLDPWNDELYTLRHFVFVPYLTTLSDYHVPNNHILFSLLLNLWRRLGGVPNLDAGLDAIVFLRLLPLIFSTAAILVVLRTAARVGGMISGVLAGLLLLSSAPFYNYGCQLRGYGLGMFIVALLMQELMRPDHRFWLLALLSAGILYTVPSNLYLLLAIALFAGIMPLDARHSRVYVPAAVIAGIALGAVLYLPVLGQLRSFSAGRPGGLDPSAVTRTAPVVAWHMLSGRWALLLLPIAYFGVRIYHRSWATPERLLCFSAAVFVIPFAISAIRGDGAPDRIFISVLPILCLSWGVMSGRAISGLRGILRPGASWLYVLLCGFALLRIEWTGMQKVITDRLHGERCADLYFQYYLHDFRPREKALRFAATYEPRIPVVNACMMDTELPKYLSMAGVHVVAADSLVRFARSRTSAYAIADGLRLNAPGSVSLLAMLEANRVFSGPGVFFVRWE